MGYASTMLYGDNFQLGADITNQAIGAVAADKPLGSFLIPSDMLIKKVYVDLSIRALSSDSGGAFNWLAADVPVMVADAITPDPQLAFTLPNLGLTSIGADFTSGIYLYGWYDVASEFIKSNTVDVYLEQAEALGSDLHLWDIQPVARIIMR